MQEVHDQQQRMRMLLLLLHRMQPRGPGFAFTRSLRRPCAVDGMGRNGKPVGDGAGGFKVRFAGHSSYWGWAE